MKELDHYMPILKGRDGEYGALKQLGESSRDHLTPLIEIPPVPWDFAKKMPAKSLDQHLEKVCLNIKKSWGTERRLLLDTLWIADEARLSNGEHPVTYLFRRGRAMGLKVVPVTGLMRGDSHLHACAEVNQDDRLGVCIRIQREDFADFGDFASEVSSVLEKLHVKAQQTDLLFDLRAVSETEGRIDASGVVALVRRIPMLKIWRSFTLSGTSFPATLMKLPASDSSKITRSEWKIWRAVRRSLPPEIRKPAFGDYAISHPEPSEVDPRIMRPSASIRYTSRGYWLVIKAKNLKDHGFKQFHALCRELIRRDEYSGSDFSWGDDYIDDCGRQLVGPGNLTTWRKVGTSHHVAFVLDQLASLASA